MADVPIDATKDESIVVTGDTVKDGDKVVTPPAEDKGDLNKALHESRAEAKAAKDRAEAAEARIAALEAKQKENERGNLSDEEYSAAVLRDAAIENTLNKVEAELSTLPSKQRAAIEKNPWLFVDQAELDAATRGLSKREGWKKATEIAIESIKDIAGEVKPVTKGEDKKEEEDPTLLPGDKSGDGEATQYTTGQLLAMSYTDPEKFARVKASSRGK